MQGVHWLFLWIKSDNDKYILPLNFIVYLCIVNGLTAIFFIADKRFAKRKDKRISESTLHLFELLGGIFAVVLLMPIIRHKNRKQKYWIISVFIFLGWIILLFILGAREKLF